jgi:hypothetical protein
MRQFRYHFFLILMAICCCHTVNAQVCIIGRIVDSEQIPIVGVNCVLLNLSDSTLITGSTSDLKGRFKLEAKEDKEYILQLSSVGYEKRSQICKPGNLGNIVLNEDAMLLDEVVVTPQILNTFGNKNQLILSETAMKVGNNALDAISSLSQFKTDISSDALVTVDNKSILVLIDGMRRSSRELKMLKADEIKNIQYYSNPPARYAHENIGAVIDVKTKKKVNKLYSLYLDTKNGITTGYGTDMLSMAYRDSLNMFTAAYFIDYRVLNDNRMNNTYSYAGKTNEYRGLPGSYNGQYHIGQLAYQRYQGKNLFNAKVEYRKSPGKQEYEQELVGKNDNPPINSRSLQSDYSSVSADLYYMYMFNQNRNLSINILNTYYHSNSDNILTNKEGGYSFENHIDNKSYSLIAEVLYGDKLWNGDFNLGAYYQYKNLDQKYNFAEDSTVDTQKEYVYADYSNAVGKFSYNIGLGLENNHYETATNEKFNYWVFRPSLSLNMQNNKHSAIRLTASINSSIPNVGDLTNSIVTIDEHFYSQGNTALKPYYYYYTNLGYQYASDNGKFYIAPSVTYSYYPNKNMPVLFTEGDDVILRITEINNVHNIGASLSLNYKPINWLVIRPFYNYEYTTYKTYNQAVKHDFHNTGISIQFLPKNWQIIWNGNLPMTLVDGDIYTRMGFNMSTSVLYKFKSMSVGMEYIYNPNPSKVYADIKGFSYAEETRWNNFKNLISLKFTYYFSKGKSRNHAGKRISNSDKDSGLININTAK